MGWINLVLRFFRLGPIGLGVIAFAILAGGYFLQVEMNKNVAARAQALADGPPETVGITIFDRDLHANAVDEVVVQAQPVLELAYRLTLERRATDDHVFMVPLVGSNAESERDIVGIAYYTSPSEDFENITPALLMQGSIGFGSVGPITNYNGKLRGMGQWAEMTNEAFADEGLQMPANPVVVWPYQEGREVALAPPPEGSLTAFGILSKVAGAIGLLALVKLVFRSKSSQTQPAPAQPQSAQTSETRLPPPVPTRTEQPLYKTRMEAKTDQPQMVLDDPNKLQGMSLDAAPRRQFSLLKGLIAVVAVAFVLLLGYVLYGLVQDSIAADRAAAVEVLTPQEAMANRVADVVVPDADPDRHWTEIDVTPIVEWFVAKATLAVAGDLGALKTLGLIAGGVIFAPLLLWFFFRTRRSLTPKTSARFDSMGIN